MWWNRKAQPEFDAVGHLRGTLAQTNAMMDAEREGRLAWRICVVNEMLAEEFRHPARRRYRWTLSEIAHISGADVETMRDYDARQSNNG